MWYTAKPARESRKGPKGIAAIATQVAAEFIDLEIIQFGNTDNKIILLVFMHCKDSKIRLAEDV